MLLRAIEWQKINKFEVTRAFLLQFTIHKKQMTNCVPKTLVFTYEAALSVHPWNKIPCSLAVHFDCSSVFIFFFFELSLRVEKVAELEAKVIYEYDLIMNLNAFAVLFLLLLDKRHSRKQ